MQRTRASPDDHPSRYGGIDGEGVHARDRVAAAVRDAGVRRRRNGPAASRPTPERAHTGRARGEPVARSSEPARYGVVARRAARRAAHRRPRHPLARPIARRQRCGSEQRSQGPHLRGSRAQRAARAALRRQGPAPCGARRGGAAVRHGRLHARCRAQPHHPHRRRVGLRLHREQTGDHRPLPRTFAVGEQRRSYRPVARPARVPQSTRPQRRTVKVDVQVNVHDQVNAKPECKPSPIAAACGDWPKSGQIAS